MRTLRVMLVVAHVLALSFGCGDDEAPTQAPAETAAVELPRGEYAAHEWGLIHYHLGGERGLATAGPGRFPPPVLGFGAGTGSGYKPVIYVHLGEGVDAAAFTAEIRAPGGSFPEHWPDARPQNDDAGASLTWSDVVARRGSCDDLEYPGIESPRCAQLPDGLCEVAELALYQTDDAACLELGGQRYNHLFYRARFTTRAPLEVTMEGDIVTVRHRGAHPIPGELLRVVRADDPEQTRVLSSAPPAPGESISVPAPSEAYDVAESSAPRPHHVRAMASIDRSLVDLGLSPAEREAFTRAWRTELFGGERAEPVQRSPVAALPFRTPSDMLLYWLPVEDAQALLPLSLSPPPTAVRRALLVRIYLATPELAEGTTANPASATPVALRQASLEVEGDGLPPEVVRRIVRQRGAQVRACWDRESKPDEPVYGSVQMRVTVGDDGAVATAAVMQSDLRNDALQSCIADVFRQMRFPAQSPTRFTQTLGFAAPPAR